MSEALTLPGSIPGLLRRGSPVRHPRAADIPCVVVAVHEAQAAIGYPWPLNGEWADSWPLADLALDLTDATGRAHAAWWLDMRTRGVPLGHAALCEQPVWWDRDGRCSHPALADLDPADPRLLPDGSRLVDALALRRVVLHVAGVTP